jgi:hypothetical protein
MDAELCAYCGKDESVGPMDDEHFVARCLWDDGHRPADMKTVRTHQSCNNSFSDDDNYFRDVLAFEEGAKAHSEIKRLHEGPIKRKFKKRFGAVKKSLKNVGWYPVHSPGGVYLGHAPCFEMDWSRVQRVLQKIMKVVYCLTQKEPMPHDWLFTIPRPEPRVFDESAQLIASMVPWQSFGDDVFCCRYCIHSEGAMGCLMAFYRCKIFLGTAASPQFHQHLYERLVLTKAPDA